MYVNLPHHFKGTHMSRFIEVLNRFHGEINLKSFQTILEEMKATLQAEAAHIELDFPYFLKKKSTLPNSVGIGEYRCRMHGSYEKEDELTVEIEVPIFPPGLSQVGQSLPRSLGHWGIADIRLRFKGFIWIEDLIQLVEEVTSHDICWPGEGVNQPNCSMSVENITQALGKKLAAHPDIEWFQVRVENFSQGYTMFATLEWPGEEKSRRH
jgi:GTP cyclohydrolase I